MIKSSINTGGTIKKNRVHLSKKKIKIMKIKKNKKIKKLQRKSQNPEKNHKIQKVFDRIFERISPSELDLGKHHIVDGLLPV